MQQMTGAGTCGQNLLFAHLAFALFTLLSHHKHLTKKSSTHNTPNPITPASTRHQKRLCVGSIMATSMVRQAGKVKSSRRQPLRSAANQPLCGRIESSKVTEQGFLRAG